MMGEFRKFLSSGITPQKAEEIVKGKLNDGSMSMQQFEQLKQQAQQMQSMMGFFK